MIDLRDPIQPTLLPKPIRWTRAPADLLARFGNAVPGRLLEVSRGSRHPLHLRAVEPESGRPEAFLRVYPRDTRAEVEFSCLVSSRLLVAGVRTPRPLGLWETADGALLALWRWEVGAYPLSKRLDFAALGRAVAALQTAISPLDELHRLAEATRTRLDALLDTRREAMRSPDWPDWTLSRSVADAVRRFPELCEAMTEAAAPTHGDLNPGNVLVDAAGFVFLDLEEVRHMRVWRGFDVAKLIERLVLTRVERFGREWARRAVAGLIGGYDEAKRGSLALPRDRLFEAMRWHLAFSVLVLRMSKKRDRAALAIERSKLAALGDLIEAEPLDP